MTETRQGTLRHLSTGQYEWWDREYGIIPVEPSDAPLETPLEIELDGDRIVRWVQDKSQPVAFKGKRLDLAYVAVWEKGALAGEEARENLRRNNEIGALNLENELKWIAGGDFEVTVTPYLVEVERKDRISISSDWQEIRDGIAEQNPNARHNKICLTATFPGEGVGGIAYTGGDRAIVYDPRNVKIGVHEVGHMLKLGHHSSGNDPYGGYSRMGHGGPGYAVPNMNAMGLIDNVAEGPGRYFLVRGETNPAALNGETQLVLHDGKAISLFRKGSYRVMIDTLRADGYQADFETSLIEGRTANGVTFVKLHHGCVAEVVVGSGVEKPVPDFRRPENPASLEGKDGLWHNPNYNHQGFYVYVLDGRVETFWFTWCQGDNKDGKPMWLEGQGPIRNNIAELTIYATNRNRDHFKVGDALLYFAGERTGMFRYRIDYDQILSGKGAISLTRLVKAEGGLTGVYDMQGRSREGLAVVEAENLIVGCHFTYDGDPTWDTFQGENNTDLTLYRPTGGFLNVPGGRSRLETLGTCKLRQKSFSWDDNVVRLDRLIPVEEAA